ncbi:MAG: ribonuclease HII [Candidatus Pacebacteria bacterium]|nr:ribonuclease HII [Candidatus Paceibacterota bacterium]
MQNGEKIVFGIDEVGRGSLAGPVMACAIMQIKNQKSTFVPSSGRGKVKNANQKLKIKDSKKLTPKQREEIYNFLKKSSEVQWGIGKVSEKVIDKINILQATKLAMEKAVLNLEKKIGKKADALLIDGNFGINIARPQQSIIKGDEKVFLISLASIIAKVERDNLMIKLHKKYPQYGFNKNKGYGTPQHLTVLSKHGPCKIHRQSFNLK